MMFIDCKDTIFMSFFSIFYSSCMNNFANFNRRVLHPYLANITFAFLFTPRPSSEITLPVSKVGWKMIMPGTTLLLSIGFNLLRSISGISLTDAGLKLTGAGL